MKKVIAGLALSSLLFVSCGTQANPEEEKLAMLLTEMVCMGQEAQEMMMKATSGEEVDMDAMQARMESEQQRIEKLMDESFESEGKAEEAYKNIADKEAFAKKLKEKAMAKCEAKEELVDSLLKEVQ